MVRARQRAQRVDDPRQGTQGGTAVGAVLGVGAQSPTLA